MDIYETTLTWEDGEIYNTHPISGRTSLSDFSYEDNELSLTMTGNNLSNSYVQGGCVESFVELSINNHALSFGDSEWVGQVTSCGGPLENYRGDGWHL